MPNAFKAASGVEAKAMMYILPFLENRVNSGRFVLTNTSLLLQKNVGDAVFNDANGKLVGVEFKAEEENKYGNLFLETWSNLSRYTLGWMFTIQADLLWYFFLDKKLLHEVTFADLRDWAFRKRRIYDFPEKAQGKYDQLNDTWGRCVPLSCLAREVGVVTHNLSHIETAEVRPEQ